MPHTLLSAKIRILQPFLLTFIYKNNTPSVNCKQRSLVKIEKCQWNVKIPKAHLDELKQQIQLFIPPVIQHGYGYIDTNE